MEIRTSNEWAERHFGVATVLARRVSFCRLSRARAEGRCLTRMLEQTVFKKVTFSDFQGTTAEYLRSLLILRSFGWMGWFLAISDGVPWRKHVTTLREICARSPVVDRRHIIEIRCALIIPIRTVAVLLPQTLQHLHLLLILVLGNHLQVL